MMGSALDLQQLEKAVMKPTVPKKPIQSDVAHPCMLCQHFLTVDFHMENRSALDFKYTQPDVRKKEISLSLSEKSE